MSNLAKVKKGDQVAMLGFTRMNLGIFKVTAASEKSITVTNAKGDDLVFSRKTGKQTNVAEGKEKYANSICLPDEAPENKPRGASKPKAKADDKKAAAKAKAKAKDEDDEDEDEDDEPAPKSRKKVVVDDDEDEDDEPAPKKNAKGGKKKPVVDDDDDFDDV